MGISGIGIWQLIAAVLFIPIALLPFLIALKKHHKYKWPIFIVNVFGGLVFGLGWIIALLWVVWPTQSDPLHQTPKNLSARALLKISAYVTGVIIFIASIAWIALFSLEQNQIRATLKYAVEPGIECTRLGTYQLCQPGPIFIRKINRSEGYQIRAFVYLSAEENAKRYGYELIWNQDCQVGTVVETSLTFTNGDTRMLECEARPWGTVMTHSFSRNSPSSQIKFDYSGFTIDEYFETSLTELERDYALRNARSADEIAADREVQRIEAAARAEEERIAAEEERIAAEERAEQERIAIAQQAAQERAEAERLEAERQEALEKYQTCMDTEDAREAEYRYRYDNIRDDIEISAICPQGMGQYCNPIITVKNNSRFTINSLFIGVGTTIGRNCPDISTENTEIVLAQIRAGESLQQNGLSLSSARRGRRICTSINNIYIAEPESYSRRPCSR